MGYLDYVNVRQGTDSFKRFSHGNTLPLTQMPHGMVSLTLQTNSERGNWFYHPSDRSLEGIRLTHQPSPWMGDYGQILFAPQKGSHSTDPEVIWSGFDPDQAVLTPSEIGVNFLRAETSVTAVPTERCAALDVHAQETNTCMTVLLPGGPGFLSVDPDGRKIIGHTGQVTDGAPAGFREYFVIECVPPLDAGAVLASEGGTTHRALSASGTDCAVHLPLPRGNKQRFLMGTSFVSPEQAEANLHREIGSAELCELRARCETAWETLLGKLEIETAEERKRTFYSCLYRVFLFPRIFYELSPQGEPIHVSMKDNSVVPGVQYTDNGYWDTYRTQYPLLSLLEPDRYREIVEGCLNFYEDTGWLPRWLSPGERGTMPGTLIDGVLADAAAKGFLTKGQMRAALQGMLHHAQDGDGFHGRTGGREYAELGYLPADHWPESVSATLDYAYGDFCISRIAAMLGDEETAHRFEQRSHGYRVLIDRKTGLMRPRNADGSTPEIWNEFRWGGAYCEGGPWQSSFQVAFDLDGWIELQGGRETCVALLDRLFAMPPRYDAGGYGKEIHEMTEMALAGLGQCAISNQPSFLTPYLYALLGEPAKAARVIQMICESAFSARADGYPGDEDNGSMAAWYVFSVLGLYPYCPGKPEYVITVPQAAKAILHLPEGKKWMVTAPEKVWTSGSVRIIPHAAITEGGDFCP